MIKAISDNYASADYISFPMRPVREIDYMNDHHNGYIQLLAEKLGQNRSGEAGELA